MLRGPIFESTDKEWSSDDEKKLPRVKKQSEVKMLCFS
jgi:hypothetical protein